MVTFKILIMRMISTMGEISMMIRKWLRDLISLKVRSWTREEKERTILMVKDQEFQLKDY